MSDGILLPDTLQEAAISVLTDDQASTAWGEEYNADVHICVQDLEDFSSGACNVSSRRYHTDIHLVQSLFAFSVFAFPRFI